jgi:hypothetical protein
MLTIYDNVNLGSEVLIVIYQSVFGIKCKFILEFINESVQMQVKIHDGSKPLNGNHYFPPDTKVDF